MTTQKTHYELHLDAGLGFFKLDSFETIELARAYAESRKSREEELYKIVSVTTTFDIPAFTIPAYVPTLEEIANDIIGGSDGSFYIEWGEDIENLSDEDRTKVEDMVTEEIRTCDCCGWYWHVDHLEHIDGESVCWKCEEDIRAEQEDEEDED